MARNSAVALPSWNDFAEPVAHTNKFPEHLNRWICIYCWFSKEKPTLLNFGCTTELRYWLVVNPAGSHFRLCSFCYPWVNSRECYPAAQLTFIDVME